MIYETLTDASTIYCHITESLLPCSMSSAHAERMVGDHWWHTAPTRDALGTTSPSGLKISPGQGFCPLRLPSGLVVQNPRPRSSGAAFPNTSLLSAVYGCNEIQNMKYKSKLQQWSAMSTSSRCANSSDH